MLADPAKPARLDDGVLVALVGHDGEGHAVHGARGGADQHDFLCVLIFYAVDVPIALDERVDVQP
eukprot:3160753-Rhodomonas_salina.1